MNHPVVDFRKPGRVPDDIGQMLTQWQRDSREAVELRFGRFVPCELRVEVPSPEPITGSDLRVLADEAIVYRVDIVDYACPTLFLLDKQLAMAMAGEMLGVTGQETPENRSLTEIETTCLDFLMEELRSSIEGSQKLTPARRMKIVGQTLLKELHSEFPANATNSSVGYRLNLANGGGLIRWILPQAVTLDMAAVLPKTIQSNSRSREAIERLVLSAPCEISVRLGESRVQLAKLGALAPGDIIILDQKIDEPLQAWVGGHRMFSGWPARNAKQQVFQIDQPLEFET